MENVLTARTRDFTIVLENIHDQHNMSACLRSCDAVGIMDVHLLYHSGQTAPEISNTSSSSAGKWLNIIKHKSTEECFAALHSEGKKIYTTRMSEEAISLLSEIRSLLKEPKVDKPTVMSRLTDFANTYVAPVLKSVIGALVKKKLGP